MDTHAIDLFLDVARRGGFAAAAKARDLDPSSVSRAIAALETDLGVRLFQRTTRRLALTEAGEAFRGRVEPLLDELRLATEEAAAVAAEPAGVLRLTASVAFGIARVAPLLPAFRAAYPKLEVECLFTDANLDLVAERIDLAIRLAPAVEGDLMAMKLMDTRYHVVASPAWIAAHPPVERPSDLASRDCVLLGLRPFRSRWRFRDGPWGDVEEVAVRGSAVISTPLGVRAAAVAGLGPALLSDLIAGDDLASGALVDLLPQVQATATGFDTGAWAVWPSRAFLPRKTRVTIDFLKDRLRRA